MKGTFLRSWMGAAVGRRAAAALFLALMVPAIGAWLLACGPAEESGRGGYGGITFQLVRPGAQPLPADDGFQALALSNAQSVVATVTGADMAAVSKTFDAAPGVSGSGVIDNVPAGSNRTVTVNAYTGDNGTGLLYYQASVTGVSVTAGQTNNLGTVPIYQVAPGTLDDSFGTAGHVLSVGPGVAPAEASAMAQDSQGRIVIVGYSTVTDDHMTVWRFNADGTADNTFNGGSGTRNYVYDTGYRSRGFAVAIDSNGKIVVAGYAISSGNQYAAIWRLNGSDGSFDTTLNSGASSALHSGYGYPNTAYAVGLDATGKIVAVGTTRGMITAMPAPVSADIMVVLRWDPNAGTPAWDLSGGFQTNTAGISCMTTCSGPAIAGRSLAIVAGSPTILHIGGFAANIDTTPTYHVAWRCGLPTAAGSAMSCAAAKAFQGSFNQGMAVYHQTGATEYMYVGGDAIQTAFWRYTLPAGVPTVDTTFGSSGQAVLWDSPTITYSAAAAMTADSSGRFLLAGQGLLPSLGSDKAMLLFRATATGAMDTSFNGGYFAINHTSGSTAGDSARAISITSSGKILVAGSSGPSGAPQMAIWRVNP